MEKSVPEGATRVNTSAEKTAPDGDPGDITLSPFYHSAVNEITQPGKYVAMSRYFTRRWQRDLGPTASAIVLHLRGECYWNHKTGELRDKTQTTFKEIADVIGVSEKTVRREFVGNKALERFVRVQRDFVRDDRRGGYRKAPNTYQVSMDDPLHPADEAELTSIVSRKAQEADKGNSGPETALDRARRRTTQSEHSVPPAPGQNVPPPAETTSGQIDRAQNERADNLSQALDNLSQALDNLSQPLDKLTEPSSQNDRTPIDYSEITQGITLDDKQDAQAGATTQSAEFVVDYSLDLVWEDQDEDAVSETLSRVAEDNAPAPVPGPARVQPPPPEETERALMRAAHELADASGLELKVLDEYVTAWRAEGDDDADITLILRDAIAVMLKHPDKDQGYTVGVIRNMAAQRRAQRREHPQASVEAKIADTLASLPAIPAAEIDAIRGRYTALPADIQAEIKQRAEKAILTAVGNYKTYRAIPIEQYRGMLAHLLPAKFLAWERDRTPQPKPTSVSSEAHHVVSASGPEAPPVVRAMATKVALRGEIAEFESDVVSAARLMLASDERNTDVGLMSLGQLIGLRDNCRDLAAMREPAADVPATQVRRLGKRRLVSVGEMAAGMASLGECLGANFRK